MSRNFDLMQELERDRAGGSTPISEPVFPVAGEKSSGGNRKVDDDLTLRLVQQIFFQQTQGQPRVVVFAGIDHGNGCSQIAASVAEALAANAPGAVCLVEANFRTPALPAMLGTTNYHGLTDALVEEVSIRSFVMPICDGKLWLLPSGPVATDSPSLLASTRLSARFAELRKEFGFVIVDAPPMTRYADAIALGLLADGVVLVLEAENTRRETALTAVENLRSSKIQVLGAVLNKRVFPIPEKIYNRL
jgi:Mrp family chromosome partitioning ATPase